MRSRRGRDRMVVGFTTIYVISVYHHWCCEFESRPGWGVQHHVIKFVSDMGQVGGFLRVLHDITEIVLKVALNTIKQTNIHILGNVTMTQFITNMTHIWKGIKEDRHSLALWLFDSHMCKGVLHTTYVMKIVTDLRQGDDFPLALQFSLPIKLISMI